jgi:hypothetical protein
MCEPETLKRFFSRLILGPITSQSTGLVRDHATPAAVARISGRVSVLEFNSDALTGMHLEVYFAKLIVKMP